MSSRRDVVGLEHRDGVVQIAEEQRVGDEAGPVVDRDVDLAEPGAERLDVVDDVGRGDDGLDDLDQLHDRRRVEEVHADDLVGPVRGDRDLGDRQRRRVGRQDRLRLADLVQLGEDLLLQVEMLGHGLDDQVDARCSAASPTANVDPAEQRVAVLLG